MRLWPILKLYSLFSGRLSPKIACKFKKCSKIRFRARNQFNKRRFYRKDGENSVVWSLFWKYANNGILEIPLFTPKLVETNHSVIWTRDCSPFCCSISANYRGCTYSLRKKKLAIYLNFISYSRMPFEILLY